MKRLAAGLLVAVLVSPAVAQEDPLARLLPLTDEYGNVLRQPDDPVVPTVEAGSGRGGIVRVLDKISGTVTDLELGIGETRVLGSLTIVMSECRYPAENPSGDAYVLLDVHYRDGVEPVFRGWMIASAPALNAMDHPRYDVWALRCITS